MGELTYAEKSVVIVTEQRSCQHRRRKISSLAKRKAEERVHAVMSQARRKAAVTDDTATRVDMRLRSPVSREGATHQVDIDLDCTVQPPAGIIAHDEQSLPRMDGTLVAALRHDGEAAADAVSRAARGSEKRLQAVEAKIAAVEKQLLLEKVLPYAIAITAAVLL